MGRVPELVLVLVGMTLCLTTSVVEALQREMAFASTLAHRNVNKCGPSLYLETPLCSVVSRGAEGYEVRSYPAGQMWAETTVASKQFEEAAALGFERLFSFTSGANSQNLAYTMTAPVLIKPSSTKKSLTVAFFVPSRFKSILELPTPKDNAIRFTSSRVMTKAVIGPFGGFADQAAYEAKWLELKAALDKSGVKYDESSVVYAGYSSPMQNRNRKQEVHVTLVHSLR